MRLGADAGEAGLVELLGDVDEEGPGLGVELGQVVEGVAQVGGPVVEGRALQEGDGDVGEVIAGGEIIRVAHQVEGLLFRVERARRGLNRCDLGRVHFRESFILNAMRPTSVACRTHEVSTDFTCRAHCPQSQIVNGLSVLLDDFVSQLDCTILTY